MDKQQWQELYSKLDQIYSDFHIAYDLYKNGSNKQKRDTGKRKVDSLIEIADSYIRNNPEAFELLTGENEGSAFHRTINYDEFLALRYFKNDLPDFLSKIQKVIKDLDLKDKDLKSNDWI